MRLSDAELARLDELRGEEERAVYLRRLLHEFPRGDEIATHAEMVAILLEAPVILELPEVTHDLATRRGANS